MEKKKVATAKELAEIEAFKRWKNNPEGINVDTEYTVISAEEIIKETIKNTNDLNKELKLYMKFKKELYGEDKKTDDKDIEKNS